MLWVLMFSCDTILTQVGATTTCSSERECYGESIGDTERVTCSGFESCRSATSISSTDAGFWATGAFAATDTTIIDAQSGLWCWGESSCRNSQSLKSNEGCVFMQIFLDCSIYVYTYVVR